MQWTLANARLATDDGVRPRNVVVRDGVIAAVGAKETAGRRVDAEGGLLLPGLVDIHCHGGGGRDILEEDADALDVVGRTHARFGTTSWLPTTWSVPRERTLAAVRRVRAAMGRNEPAPDILGIHLEGPYLNVEQKGAHDPDLLRPADPDEYEPLLAAAALPGGGTMLRHWTVAPEAPGVMALIRRARPLGVSISLGHTQTTYEVVAEAVAAGANHVTHLFNAMQGVHRGPIRPGQGNGRLPGVVGAALELDGLTVEVIADNVHVHPALIRVVLRCKGLDNVLLVSDAMAAVGTGSGDYAAPDGRGLRVRDASVTLAGEAGKLASSPFPLLHMLRTMVEIVGVPLPQAVRMATANPARVAGAGARKGRLAPGFDADLMLMDDDWRVRRTWVRGQLIHEEA